METLSACVNILVGYGAVKPGRALRHNHTTLATARAALHVMPRPIPSSMANQETATNVILSASEESGMRGPPTPRCFTEPALSEAEEPALSDVEGVQHDNMALRTNSADL